MLTHKEPVIYNKASKGKQNYFKSMNYSLSKKHASYGRKLHIQQPKHCEI